MEDIIKTRTRRDREFMASMDRAYEKFVQAQDDEKGRYADEPTYRRRQALLERLREIK